MIVLIKRKWTGKIKKLTSDLYALRCSYINSYLAFYCSIANNAQLKVACEKLNLSVGLLDNVGNAAIAILPKLIENLQSGLGKRIQLLDVQLKNNVTVLRIYSLHSIVLRFIFTILSNFILNLVVCFGQSSFGLCTCRYCGISSWCYFKFESFG